MSSASIYCLGDMVGYGANPNEVVDWIRENATMVIKGNHDEAIITGKTSWFNKDAAKAVIWTKNVLTPKNNNYLKNLPSSKLVELSGVKVLMVHGSPIDELNEYVYPDTHENMFDYYLNRFNVKVVGVGHTHIPFKWSSPSGIVFNPGSVGQSRTGISDSSYAILNLDDSRHDVTHFQIKYDVETAAKKIETSGLPKIFATRLHKGI